MLGKLIERLRISFCCKSKCSLNDISEGLEELNDIVEELDEGVEWRSVEAEKVKKKYNYNNKQID